MDKEILIRIFLLKLKIFILCYNKANDLVIVKRRILMKKMSADCNSCGVYKCEKGEIDNLPKFCPMENQEIYEEAAELLKENEEFFKKCSEIERKGYGEWPRVREIVEFVKDMNFEKIGLAFCSGFKQEAQIFSEICKDHGIQIVTAMCKTGGSDKSNYDIDKINPGKFEAHCNPIGQALVFNKEGTEYNVVLGLCVGHDSLFMKYSDALCTTLVVKDRVTGHNPAVALYLKDSYMREKLDI